jgi:hypothetical protein
MLKVNNPDISAAPIINAILVKSNILISVKFASPLLINCSIAVIESPTRLGATTANTREDTVNTNPSSIRNRYFFR